MYIALSILLVAVSIFIHEVGHAYAMIRRGIPVIELGLGFKVKFFPYWSFMLKKYNLRIIVSPLLLGGYVKNHANTYDKIALMSYKDQAVIYGAGIIGNILFSLVLYLYVILMYSPDFNISDPLSVFTFFVFVLFGTSLWFGRRFICKYIFPVLGFVMLGLVFYSLMNSPTEAVSGPVGIAIFAAEESVSFSKSIIFAIAISLLIGLFNLIPMYPLDGGRIINAFIEKKIKSESLSKFFKRFGSIALIMLIVFAFYSDFLRLF